MRMMRHAVDDNVFIRSLATHHCGGGLSDAALHCARLLELAGYDPVLIETVGVGQNEVDVASVADICVLVLGPGYGDDIQLTKAGLLEIAHIVVVNKCDLPDANRLLKEVRAELGLSSYAASVVHHSGAPAPASEDPPGSADVPIRAVGIEARSGKGVDQLLEKLLEMDRAARGAEHRQRQRHRRLLGEIKRSATLMYEQALQRRLAAPAMKELVAKLERGELSLEEVVSCQLSAIGEEAIGKQGPNTDN